MSVTVRATSLRMWSNKITVAPINGRSSVKHGCGTRSLLTKLPVGDEVGLVGEYDGISDGNKLGTVDLEGGLLGSTDGRVVRNGVGSKVKDGLADGGTVRQAIC